MIRYGSTLRLIAIFAALCLAVGLDQSDRRADAHAALDISDPPANAVLAAAPTQVSLWFTEPLERSYSKAVVHDQYGVPVPGAMSRPGSTDNALVIDLPPNLPTGTYSVVWQTLSNADGHTAQAYFAFTIGTQADVAAVVQPISAGTGGVPLWLQSFARWIVLIGLSGLVAVWPMWLLVFRPAISPAWQAGPTLARRVQRLAQIAVVFALCANIVALTVQAAGLPSGSLISNVQDTLFDTRYGGLWLMRVVLIIALAQFLMIASWWRPRAHRWTSALVLLTTLALPIPVSLNAHASALTTGRSVAIAFDVVHLLAASLWIGGLYYLLLGLLPTMHVLTPAGRTVVLGRVLPRFSAIALVAWVALGLTGLYSAWLHVGNLEGLRETAYGQSLRAKLIVLLPILVIASFNLMVMTRRLKRHRVDQQNGLPVIQRLHVAIAAEVALALLVLVIVGRLTSQQPARDVLAARAEATELALPFDDRDATLSLAPAAVGPNHYVLDVGGALLPEKTEAVLRLTIEGQALGEKEVKLSRSSGNRFESHGSELSIAGDWTIVTIVRSIGEFQYEATRRLTVGATPPEADLPGPAWTFSASAIGGLVLLVVGTSAIVFAWYVGRSALRRESMAIGTVAISCAVLLFMQARVDTAATTTEISLINPVPADAASITRGESSFLTNCASCHGIGGTGNGPAAPGLDPAPADFSSSHSRTHREAEFFGWIKYGKPPTEMPDFADDLSDDEIWDLVNYIRVQFQGFPAEASPDVAASPIAAPGD